MASPYEAIKVQNLIRTYKTNPTMFNDDQLDELERLAENNEIEFKRRQSEFSLRRGLQQAQAGFIEGLTTFDLIPKEPRNTGEAIFRQLGHLAGFAPAILKAPVMGVVQVASKVTGKKAADIARQPFTSAVLDGINALDAISVPMIGSRLTKKGFDAALTKTGAESLELLKRGSRTRAITEEALGLASASAISNIWKGKDAIVDSYIGGAIAGGAFGGIGNFVSLGNRYKSGTPQQVEQANKLLRAGVASMFMGLPSTLRNDPTEMQIYEYLLGGFFGYNTRPAKEVEAGKWINENRAREEIFRPETSKDWNKVNKNAQEFIIREHPMTKELNSEGHGGSTGAALGYLERRFPNAKWREGALNNLKKNNKEATESNIQDFYRKKAYEAYRIEKKVYENAVLANSSIINDERLDAMDQAQRDQFKIEDISNSISNASDKYGDKKSVGEKVVSIAEKSLINNVPNREIFIRELEKEFDSKTIKKMDSKLRGWFNNYSQRFVEQDIVNIDGQEYRIITKEKIGEVDVGEKVDVLPATYLVPEGEFRLMTHFIREVPSKNGQVKQEAIKIMKTDLVFDYGIPTVKNRLDGDAYIRLQNLLEENGRYIVSGIKDKDYVMTGRFRDESLTLDNVFDILSNKQAGILTRKQVEDAYNRSLEKEKELSEFEYEGLERLHERKWISNFVNLAEMNNLKLEDAWAIIDPAQNFGKSVADLNKRMSLVTNRMTPMVKESFENVAGMNKGEKFNVIQIKDVLITDFDPRNFGFTGSSDTDGYMAFRHDIFDATTKSFGRDVKNTGHNKPVIAAKTASGFFTTKTNGQRAHESLNEWMMKNDVHAVVYTSGSKLKGNNPISTLKYEKGNYVSDNINRIEIPIDKLQVSSGTYENTKKDVKGASVPMQKSGQANEEQAFGFADKWIDTVVKPSLEGSERGQKILEDYQKTNDLTEMSKAFENKDIKLEELPFRFVIDTLLKNPDSKLGRFFSDRLMRLEVDGELDKTVFEDSFSPDSDTAFREYHRTNDLLAEALRGSFVAKHSMPFNKKNYFNALRKFVLKRFANPHIETAGKSWLKGYTPEMLNFFDIDPEYRGKKNKLNEGDLYLDNGFQQMPVVLLGKQYTLGEVWDMYTGRKTMPEGIKKPTKEEWNDVFTLLAIRTPADSMSGTRKLRFRGFTGQRGAGSITHHKDNKYLGGADKDGDSIKIFQNMNKDLIKYFENVKDERIHWENKDGSKSDYSKKLDELFKGDVSQQVVDDFNKNKIMMFSPSFRFEVARNASMGKGGLGFGLNAKINLQNMYDYVQAKGGSIKLKNSKGEVVTLEIKYNSPYEGVSAHRFFLDLGTKVVNVSADASNDPNLRPYSEYRDMLSSSIFKINNKDANFGQIKNLVKGTPLEGIMMSNTNIKPHQKYLNEKTNEREAPDVFQVLDNINKANELMFSDLDDSFSVRTVNPKLNQLIQESGFEVGNYLFPKLQKAHKVLYDSFITSESGGIPKNPDALYKWEVVNKKVTGRLIINNNKTSKQLEGFYKILAKELSFTSPNRMKNLLTPDSRKFNPDQALDFLGKDMGQYALMELLTGQYVAVQNAFAKQGRNVNTVIELLPEIKKNAYEIKRLSDTISRRRDGGDNVRNVDLDALIYKHKTRLANLERAQGLEDGMLQNYLHYWLLSPTRALVKGQNKPQYYKAIHGSQMIPMSVKRNFYNRMDKIYERAQSSDMLSIKQADFKTALNKLESTQKLSTTINEAIKSKSLENLALFESDLKEVRKFQESVKNNSLMDRDFNEWYTAFTKNMVDGPTKDATTITMQDIKLVNRYLDSLNTSKNMELKLAQFYQHPLTVDEIMQSKGLFGGYTKTINEPVLTSKGLTKRNVKVIMSPVGNIANYFKKSEAGINLYQGRMKLETVEIDKILDKLTPNQRKQYAEALFAYREGVLRIGNVTIKYSLKDIPKEINMTKFKKLDKELTKFWKQMEDSWITTKNINGNRFNWAKVDKEKRYGKVNEYIEYDSSGKFNFKKFHDKVINARNQSKDIIRKVGIEGVLRYRMEESIEKEILSDKSIKDKKAYREMRRSELSKPYQNRSYENYVHHSFNNAPEGLLKEQADYIASIKDKKERSRIARLLQTENPFINVNDILEIATEGKTKDFNKYAVYSEVLEKQGDIPYKRSFDSLQDYQTKAIGGYFRNLMKLKAQNELDLMVKNTKDYKPSKHEQKLFNDLYKGVSFGKTVDTINYKVDGKKIVTGNKAFWAAQNEQIGETNKNALFLAGEILNTRGEINQFKVQNLKDLKNKELTSMEKKGIDNFNNYKKLTKERYSTVQEKNQFIDRVLNQLKEVKGKKRIVGTRSSIPKELRYNSHVDVWADYVRLYARDSLGNQSFLSNRMVTPQGKKLLHLNKKNLWYGTSDEAIINKMEKLYNSKIGEKRSIPFFNKDAIPKDPVARKEYFSRVIHNLGRMEAQYELLTLLANTGTWTTNIFGGATMTIGSAGAKNYANSFNNKRVYDTLLSDANGNPVLKLLNGTNVRNRKQLLTFLEERGVIDNFIKNEFEYNDRLKIGLKKAGISIKDFKRDLIKAAKSKKGNRDESVMEVVKRYGVTDLMLETGGFLMKQSERVNRLNAFIAHGLQAVEGFKEAGKELSLADQYVFEKAERGIEMTQFLYQNAYRPAFMRTSMGKVLGRFKLFVFNSVRMRKEFYKQAKLNGFKQGSESYERFKDTFAIDMMMYALGSAFMFSLFDTTLPPPWDWVQALADYTFGDKREREMAFFGSKLGPLNVLKPPIARVPEAFGELLTGQYEDFTNYTVYTMFPFGRGIRQIKQLADDRPFHGVERAPEILFRIPRTQAMSRIKRMQSENEKRRAIEELLN